MKLYKVLNQEGKACNGGNGKWFLPKGKPGKWMPKIEGKLVPCNNGYHLCRREDLLEWIGPRIFEAEHRGQIIKRDDKVVVREARLVRELPWDEKKARLFAADCAEHVLHIFEKKYPKDDRPRKAVEAARAFARGEISKKELDAARAAGVAALDAAGEGVWCAAGDAAFYYAALAAGAGPEAVDAAWAAALYAAKAVIVTAGAAWTETSLGAAGDAAYYATRVAGVAAIDSARDVRDAKADERKWQTEKLFEYLK